MSSQRALGRSLLVLAGAAVVAVVVALFVMTRPDPDTGKPGAVDRAPAVGTAPDHATAAPVPRAGMPAPPEPAQAEAETVNQSLAELPPLPDVDEAAEPGERAPDYIETPETQLRRTREALALIERSVERLTKEAAEAEAQGDAEKARLLRIRVERLRKQSERHRAELRDE